MYSGLVELERLEGRSALAQHAAEARRAVRVGAVERAHGEPPQRTERKPRAAQAVANLAPRVVELQERERDGRSVAALHRAGDVRVARGNPRAHNGVVRVGLLQRDGAQVAAVRNERDWEVREFYACERRQAQRVGEHTRKARAAAAAAAALTPREEKALAAQVHAIPYTQRFETAHEREAEHERFLACMKRERGRLAPTHLEEVDIQRKVRRALEQGAQARGRFGGAQRR